MWATSPSPVTLNFNASITFLYIWKDWIGNKEPSISLETILTKAWFIWKERCDRIFENKQKTSTQLGAEIMRYLEFWNSDKGLLGQAIKTTVEPPKWLFPRKSQFKLNIDAVWVSSTLPAGFSLILRNDIGDLEQGGAGPISAATPEEVEALGLWHGAKWALDNGWSNFSVEGDCKKLFDYLNGKPSQIEWKNQSLMDVTKYYFNKCKFFLGFFYIPRLANQVADTLAKESKSFVNFVNWDKNPPTCILSNLEVDKSNVRDKHHITTLENSTINVVRVSNSLN